MTKILIMGLPGSGKTTLAKKLEIRLYPSCLWLNADAIREEYNDWDFTYEGRIRQANRMKKIAERSDKEYVICDFVAPLKEMRDIFNADITVWMDTIKYGRYEDTNKLFEAPIEEKALQIDENIIRIKNRDSFYWSHFIWNHLEGHKSGS